MRRGLTTFLAIFSIKLFLLDVKLALLLFILEAACARKGKRSFWKSLDDEQNAGLALATEVEGVTAVSADDDGPTDFGRMDWQGQRRSLN
jgi:hypothetical protein